MLERGMAPDFPPAVDYELRMIRGPVMARDGSIRDLRHLLWCSIDNDDSRDLDQLSVAEPLAGGATRILVAIADVDSIARVQTAIDDHARQNTTSVYTAAQVFPMLPERLSTDLTSLNYNADRTAVIVETVISRDGALVSSDIYQALVRNYAKLAYNSVAAWLDGQGPMPQPITVVAGLEANIRLQDQVAQKLKSARFSAGAVELETIETRPVYVGDGLKDLKVEQQNRAHDLIAEFMVSANGVVASFLAAKKVTSLQRIVRTPKRWDRIVEIAREHGHTLPNQPDSAALNSFLAAAKAADPLRFPDLSFSVVKSLGPGEYVVQIPGQAPTGHFALALRKYAHSTAPNRRYPDLITQRLLKAVLRGEKQPYRDGDLETLATHCTAMENAAKKVERQVAKSAAAMLLENRIGHIFDGIVTGASEKGTWVRIFQPPVEGRLATGFKGVDVGHRVRVQLVYTDVERGFIDFKRV